MDDERIFDLFAPNGSRITGTAELTPGFAAVDGWMIDQGKLRAIEYPVGVEHYDSETEYSCGMPVYVSEDFGHYTLDQLAARDGDGNAVDLVSVREAQGYQDFTSAPKLVIVLDDMGEATIYTDAHVDVTVVGEDHHTGTPSVSDPLPLPMRKMPLEVYKQAQLPVPARYTVVQQKEELVALFDTHTDMTVITGQPIGTITVDDLFRQFGEMARTLNEEAHARALVATAEAF